MRRIITLIVAAVVALSSYADTFRYSFTAQPLAKALSRMADEHPGIEINFIYNELENYKTSANVNTSDPYEALRRVIGLNPVTIIQNGKTFYIEALQHGKYSYTGRAIGTDNEPVIAATVMLLAPKDSTVITYGITDEAGRFSIPCDRKGIIAKLTCIGYQPTYRKSESFSLGTIIMPEKALALKEVKVDAEMQWTSTNASTYIPSKRQKEVSQDAVALLSHMAIPQLNVDPVGQSVCTASGQPVSIFIDYVSATAQDLSGMRTTDVKKVEYLLNPQDVRFKGAQYVINFIMQKYEWGGYTKLHADKWFGVNRSEGSVYSKFSYKKMTYDIYADEVYLTNRHMGVISSETFRLPNHNGNGDQRINRFSSPISALYRNNSNNITLRALYASDKTQISNLFQFNNTSIPHNDNKNTLTYANDFIPASVATKLVSNHNMGFNYNLEAYRGISQKLGVSISTFYRFDRNKLNSDYFGQDIRILNNADERSHWVSTTPCIVWNPNKHNNILPYIHAEYVMTKLDYSGNSPSRQNYEEQAYMAGIKYTYQREKCSAGGLVGWGYNKTNITGCKIEGNYPQGNVFGTYSPNKKNQLEFTYAFGKNVPDIYQKSPNMLQQDELMWVSGTPGLDNYWHHNVRLTYTWLPDNKWQVSPTVNYFTFTDRVVPIYTPIGPDGEILKKYENNGDYHYGMVGFNGTAKFLKGYLVARLNPMFTTYVTTGEYDLSLNNFLCTAQLTWYFGQFYLFGWYTTPMKEVNSGTGTEDWTPSRYQIQLGWGKGAWRASATAYNFLHTSWSGPETTLASPYYSFTKRSLGISHHMRFQFSLTYTVGYGKKVQQGNEVNGMGAGKSAILK